MPNVCVKLTFCKIASVPRQFHNGSGGGKIRLVELPNENLVHFVIQPPRLASPDQVDERPPWGGKTRNAMERRHTIPIPALPTPSIIFVPMRPLIRSQSLSSPTLKEFSRHKMASRSAHFRPKKPEGRWGVAWVQINIRDPATVPVLILQTHYRSIIHV